MTSFSINNSDLARLDARLRADIGLLEGDEANPGQLRKLPPKTGAFDIFIDLLLSLVWTSGRDARVR